MINKNRWWLTFVIYVGEHTFPVHASMSAQPHTLEAHPWPLLLRWGGVTHPINKFGKRNWVGTAEPLLGPLHRKAACLQEAHIFCPSIQYVFKAHGSTGETQIVPTVCLGVCLSNSGVNQQAHLPADSGPLQCWHFDYLLNLSQFRLGKEKCNELIPKIPII